MMRPIFLCIGSDKCTADSLGPLVGFLLRSVYHIPYTVFGDLSEPVTAINLSAVVRYIKRNYPSHAIIAIDSAIGRSSEIGKITVKRGGIIPGKGCGKNLGLVGDMSITAVVDSSPENIFSTRLGVVFPLALKIASSICNSLCPSIL